MKKKWEDNRHLFFRWGSCQKPRCRTKSHGGAACEMCALLSVQRFLSCPLIFFFPSVLYSFSPHSTVCLILLFSQYLSKVDVPMITYQDKKWKVFQYPLFKLFSVSGQTACASLHPWFAWSSVEFFSPGVANTSAPFFSDLSGLRGGFLCSA